MEGGSIIETKQGDWIANRYVAVERLGEGAMGHIWLVEDSSTGHRVALKQFVATHRESAGLRLKQDFKILTRFTHPGCCRFHEFGLAEDGAPYYTMEVIPGQGLNELLPMPAERARDVLVQLLRALGHVHSQGFVHRDIKAENVRITPDGTVKLLDFDLLEHAGRSEMPISGTVGYLAPEVIKRGPVDQRADLYSVGALAFEMLSGQLPFRHASGLQVLKAHLSEPPPDLSSVLPDVAPDFAAVVARLLAKEPNNRFPSADAVLEALGQAGEAATDVQLLAPPLLGRIGIVTRVEAVLDEFRISRNGTTLVLCGAAGIGKSRLLATARAKLELDGVTLTAGSAREQASPYNPFREALRGLLPALREHRPDLLEAHAPVLVSLLPELRVAPAAAMHSANREKVRLQGAVSQVLAGLAEACPYVLLFEDWHWADPLSAELLDYVLRNTTGLPVLTMLTTRALPLQTAWLGHAEVIEVGRMPEVATRAVVMTMLGTRELDPRFLDAIARITEGNPFYVERCLEHLIARGLLTRVAGRWKTPETFDAAIMPADLRSMMLEKLQALPLDALGVARVASAIDAEFNLELVQAVTGLDDDRLLDAVELLQRNQVFVRTDQQTLMFAHAIYRDLVYQGFTPAERTATHAEIAHVLEGRFDRAELRTAAIEKVMAIADHYILGCIPDKIIAYGIEAGRRSAALFAARDAEHYLSNVLKLLRSDDRPRWQKPKLLALRLLADTERLFGKNAEARDLYLEAIPLAKMLDATDYLTRMMASLADVHGALDQMDEALACCGQALEVAKSSENMAAAVRAHLTSGMLNFMVGNLANSLANTQEALSLARVLADKNSVAEALAFLGHLFVASVPNRTEEGTAYLEEAVGILAELGNHLGLQSAYNLLGAAQFRQGCYGPAAKSFGQNRRICFELGLKEDEAFALLNLAITAFELGTFTDGLAYAMEADAIANQRGYAVVQSLALTFCAVGQAYIGRLAEADKLANESLSLFRASNNKHLESRGIEHHTALLLYMGRLPQAQAMGESLLTLLAETGNSEPLAHVHTMLGEIACRKGDFTNADTHLDIAIQRSEAAQTLGELVYILKVRALVALERMQYDDARSFAKEALLASYRTGMQYQTAELQGLQGEIELATGQGSAASPYFQAMTQLAESMGAALPRALGHFGQAAANPYGEAASHHATEARQIVQSMVEGLESDAAASFWGPKERMRVMIGNYVDFSFKKIPSPSAGTRMKPHFNRDIL
jgi:tetratricopeptide (TPR) repeat protein